MVKGWVGAAGSGFVGAAPLFEAGPLPGNWSYANTPGMGAILDASDNITKNVPTGLNRGSAKWPYGQEVTTEPILDDGYLTHNKPTSFARGHSTEPYNASARGLGLRADAKIKKPWLWP